MDGRVCVRACVRVDMVRSCPRPGAVVGCARKDLNPPNVFRAAVILYQMASVGTGVVLRRQQQDGFELFCLFASLRLQITGGQFQRIRASQQEFLFLLSWYLMKHPWTVWEILKISLHFFNPHMFVVVFCCGLSILGIGAQSAFVCCLLCLVCVSRRKRAAG